MRLSKIRLRAPSPILRLSVITNATHEITLDMAGIVFARPRSGGKTLVYSDFAEAETLDECDADPIQSPEQPILDTTESTRIDTTPSPAPIPETILTRPEQVTLSERDIESTMVLSVDTGLSPQTPAPYSPPRSDDYKFGRGGGKNKNKYSKR